MPASCSILQGRGHSWELVTWAIPRAAWPGWGHFQLCFPSPLSSQGTRQCAEGVSDMILFNMHISHSTDWKLG